MKDDLQTLRLFLVSEGVIIPANAETEWDGEESVLVAATSPEGALVVAAAYDRGEITADNLAWEGKTIAVVTLRDAETGRYL
jgi:hypothetical protein